MEEGWVETGPLGLQRAGGTPISGARGATNKRSHHQLEVNGGTNRRRGEIGD